MALLVRKQVRMDSTPADSADEDEEDAGGMAVRVTTETAVCPPITISPLLPSSASPAASAGGRTRPRRCMSAPLPAPCMADKPWRIHHAFQTLTNGFSFSFAGWLHWPACDSFRWLNVPSDYISACVLMIITPFLSELTASPSD